MKKINCVIFDLDGVIVSTDDYHYEAWKYMAELYQIPFNKTINEKLRGVSRSESLDIIVANSKIDFNQDDKDIMMEVKNNYYVESLKSLSPQHILPGVLHTLDLLNKKKIQLAIGSSSKNAKKILEYIKLVDYFDFIADGTKIINSKPNPEVFLLAARELNENPENCFVVEDAESGIEAAIRAKMPVLAIGKYPFSIQPDYSCSDLNQFEWKKILELNYENIKTE